MNAFERYALCWLDTLITVSQDVVGLKIPDVTTSGKAYRVFVSQDTVEDNAEYFLIENRASNTTYYSSQSYPARCAAPEGSGLLIWHVDQGGSYWGNSHKRVDLECASGLFELGGVEPDPFRGLDGLDSLSSIAHDSLDFFTHRWNSTFTSYSNPNSNGYYFDLVDEEWEQTVHTGRSITNIRKGTADTMIVDIHLDEPSDTIRYDTNWAKWMILGGDLVAPDEVALTIEEGAVISFVPDTDYEESGFDTERTELVVDGDLLARGTSSDSIFFRPAGIGRGYSPDTSDWYGIRLRGSAGDTLAYCRVQHGYSGISLNDVSTGTNTTLIRHCWVDSNAYAGIECDHADPVIDSCLIEYNGAPGVGGLGIYLCNSDARLWGNTIRKNLPYNVYWIGGNPDSGSVATIGQCNIGGLGKTDDLDAYGIVMSKNILRGSRIVETTVRKHSQAGISMDYHWGFTDVDTCNIWNNWTGILANPKVQAPPGEGDTVIVSKSLFKLNTVGVRRQNYGGTVILGDSLAGLGRSNSFTTNTTDVSNGLTDTLMAEHNWWGSDDPDDFDIVGPVDYEGWLKQGPGQGQMGPSRPSPLGDEFALCYGNPSSGRVEFVLTLRERADVAVGIYDVRGRLITVPYGEALLPGKYAFAWDGRDSSGKQLGSGIYFCRITAGTHIKTSKVVLLK
jgi:hypothetical protein